MARLKVYRTAIGFHDAYVAAPSQKAALAAWGSEKDLFARGAAEIVDDPALTKEPLAHPGTVVRRLRGTAAEQLAALPPDRPKPRKAEPVSAPEAKRAASKSPPPPPSRVALDEADAAVEEAEQRHRGQLADLTQREKALAEERQHLVAEYRREADRNGRRREAAARAYEAAVRNWKQAG